MQKSLWPAAALLVLSGATVSADSSGDPWLWLEEVQGERALEWVEEQNAASLGYLESQPLFRTLKDRSLEILDSDQRIAMPGLRGEHVYNFWQDATNRRGIWRRTTLSDFVHGRPDWQVLLDVDALAEAEDEDWVWKGANCLPPDYRRCLVSLSRGGADATVLREFDTTTGEFVTDGFELPEAKSWVSWADEDTLYVGTDFGDGSLTDSGYPRIVKLWKRGRPLDEANEIFAGERSDVAAGVTRIRDHGKAYDIASRAVTFFETVRFLHRDGELVRIDIPNDAELHGILRGQMIVELKSAWQPIETEYPQGALIAIDFARFMQEGDRDFEILIEPTPSSAIVSGAATGILRTRNHLVVNELVDVVNRLTGLTYADGRWQRREIGDAPENGRIMLVSADERSDYFFFTYESFLVPDTLHVGRDGGAKVGTVASLPAFFDTQGLVARQYFATSRDGTRIPYFLVGPDGEPGGAAPTLLYGYGGFEVSMAPSYSAVLGEGWLSRGGYFALANIRGGGEYGPRWHRAALRENRQRAYDDFIAVAEDLIRRGITSPEHLGIRGGSNGGLLAGVMLTQRPELFDAAVVQVPLLDMKRYHRLLAGASWMGEYGDPDTADWEFIRRYSPYHNVDPDADYPVAFFTTSTRDDRVHPGHARKMVARMKEMGHEVLYYENIVGGHAGASDNAQRARVEALIYTYLWNRLGEDPDSGG